MAICVRNLMQNKGIVGKDRKERKYIRSIRWKQLPLSGTRKHAQSNVFPVFTRPSSLKKSLLFAQRVFIVIVRERWRSGYLWGLSLFGTTSLRSVSFWVTLSRSCELRQVDCWTSKREAKLFKSRRFANTKRWTMVNFLQVDESWRSYNKR